MSINRSFEGFWFVPNFPEKKLWGTLELTPKGSFLTIQGNISDNDSLNKYEILHGYSDGSNVTLYNCQEISITSISHDNMDTLISKIIINIDIVFLGYHFEDSQNIKFDYVNVEYNNLTEWANPKLDKSVKDNKLSIDLKDSVLVKLISNDEMHASLISFWKYSQKDKNISLKPSTIINISVKEEKNLTYFISIVEGFQHLITISSQNSSSILKIVGVKNLEMIEIIYDAPYSIANISHQRNFKYPYGSKLLSPDNLIELGFNVSKWFDILLTYKSVFDLYLPVKYGNTNIQVSFVNMIHALEGYHRIRFGGSYQTKEEYHKTLYQNFINSIPDNIEEEYKESLKRKLLYLHEYSLSQRLKYMVSLCIEIAPIIMNMNKKTKKLFIKLISDLRNDFSHPDNNREFKYNNILYPLSEWMMFVLEILLLSELGVSNNNINAISSEAPQYQYMIPISDLLAEYN